MPYRDSEPHRSQTELQQYYDADNMTPYARSGVPPPNYNNISLHDIPLVHQHAKYAGGYYADSQPADVIVQAPIPQNNAWREKPATRSGGRRAWLLALGAVSVIGLIGAGITLGFVLLRKNASSSSSSSSSASSPLTPSNDPSSFTKDANLVQSFYGIAYTPENSQLPDCGNRLDDIITDIQLLSQLTTRIRLYGADCNQTELVLEAIKQTKVDMTVWLGNYVATDGGTAYARQRDEIVAAVKKYGVEHIGGITVGNEFMLNYLTANGAKAAGSSVGNVGAALLLQNVTDTRMKMSALSLGSIPIGTSDAGSYFNSKVLKSVDYGMANVHPWFADVSIDQAAAWTAQFFQDTNIAAAAKLSNKPQMFIAETGWPTQSSNSSLASNGASAASVENLQIFLDTFVCQANANGTKYFFFEYFDEKWKDDTYGGVEGWWGLFHQNRTLKSIRIPTC